MPNHDDFDRPDDRRDDDRVQDQTVDGAALRTWAASVQRGVQNYESTNETLNQKLIERLLDSEMGAGAAERLRAAQSRADPVCATWSRLIALRDGLHSELKQLVVELANVDDRRRYENRTRLRRVTEDLEHLDTEIARAFGNSKTLTRAREIVEAYEEDGFPMDPPTQRRGVARRRLEQRVAEAFEATLPVIEALYGDSTLLELNEAEFASELSHRLHPTNGEIVLHTVAVTVDMARTQYDPNTRVRSFDEALSALLGHLRHKAMITLLRPLGRSGGEGTGPKHACFHLIARATGVGWARVRDYVATSGPLKRQRSPVTKRKAPTGKPRKSRRN